MYRVWIGDEPRDEGPLTAMRGWPVLAIKTESKNQGSDIVQWPALSDVGRVTKQVQELWPEYASQGQSLLEHALREGAASDLFLGTTPETWSPAGKVDHASLGRWRANAELMVEMARKLDGESDWELFHHFETGKLDRNPCITVSDEDDAIVSRVCIDLDAFLVLVPPGRTQVRFTATEVHPNNPNRSTLERMAEGISQPESRELLLWRLYEGDNSWVTDRWSEAINGIHNLAVDGAGKVAILVGRVVSVVARRAEPSPSDPLLRIRRLSARKDLPEEARRFIDLESPSLGAGPKVSGGAVIVVHGTHSHGMHLAVQLRGLWPGTVPPVPIIRFEHDTWHRLEQNAIELADGIRASRASSVLVVAHSRGGLVATRALAILANGSDADKPIHAKLITLGTPFLGTPLAHAADALWASVHTAMGAVRLVGGPALDAITRILSWTIKKSPPDGIRLMYPTSDVLPSLRDGIAPDAILVAGHTDDGESDYYGLKRAWRGGLAEGAFGGERNDLVVETSSSLAGRTSGIVISSDHSSYLLEPTVQQVIKNEAEALPKGLIHQVSGREMLTW